MKPFGRTDFTRAFRPGEVFIVPHNGKMIARQQTIGQLHLHAGQLIACDPSYLRYDTDIMPFAKTLPPGSYPVRLALIDDFDSDSTQSSEITCACIDFTSENPESWELALLPGQDGDTLPLGSFFGFGVDCGMACFLDKTTWQQIKQQPCDSWLHQLVRPWANITIDPTTGANLIAFKAGYGDGEYPSYWGRDAAGTLCCLVTDFHVLVADVEDEASFMLPEWKETELSHADFSRTGITIRCIPQDATGHHLLLYMTGDHPLIIIRDGQREYCSDNLPLHQYGHDVFKYYFIFDEPLSCAATITIRYLLGVTAI